MKTLKIGEITKDVSYLSNSECYLLVEALAPYHEKVSIVSDQVNKFALKKGTVMKCYKINPQMWAGKKGWEMVGLPKPTTTTLAISKNEHPGDDYTTEYEGIVCTEEAMVYLAPRPKYFVEVAGEYLWASTDKGLAILQSISEPVEL